MKQIFAYLLKARFLDRDVVKYFVDKGLIYESAKYHNCVFVGIDKNGKARHAHKRGTYTLGDSFKGNVESVEAEYSFHHTGTSNVLYVFEAPIDMLSYISLHKENWIEHSYVSLCSVSDRAAIQMLKDNPQINKIYLCLDNDLEGIDSDYRIRHNLNQIGYNDVAFIRPKYKDWNEILKAKNGIEPLPAVPHPALNKMCELIKATVPIAMDNKTLLYPFKTLCSDYTELMDSDSYDLMMQNAKQLLDLRNPTKSHGNNLLHLVNKYIDMYKVSIEEKKPNISYKAKAEKYAKIISKTIILNGMDGASFGQNAFFYDAAEGLLTSAILLVAEFAPKEKRHIVSVFKIIQDLLAPSKVKGQTQFKQLLDKLPPEHKARWFAGAALNSGEQSMMSVMSTAMSRLNAFLDTELEQILCFDTEIDAEKFCNEKSAIFIVMPEEDDTKYFMVSLILQQFYREILTVADENNGKLKNRVMMYLDEFGTLPKIQSAELMFSAGRSRKISIVPIIQSFAQLNQNYGAEGAEIITDNTQLTIFGGFAPNSKSAEVLSKAMGSRTVMSGSVSRGKNDPSQSLQMIERPLMTPDELKSMPKGQFIVMKTGHNPMKIKLKLFFKWGIKFEKPFSLEEQETREVKYLNKTELESAINELYGGEELSEEEIQAALAKAGQLHAPQTPITEQEIERRKAKKKNKDKDSKGGGQSIAKNNVPIPKMNNVK